MDPGLYFLNLAHICLISSLGILLFNWKRLSRIYMCLGYYLMWNFLIELSAWAFQMRGINNLPLLHLYTWGEFLLFSWFYREVFPNASLFSQHFRIFLITVSILIVGNSLFVQSIYGFNSYAKALVQVILISYSMYYFFNTENEYERKGSELRWVHSSVLVYYSGSFFIYLFSDYFLRYGEGIPKEFWMFNAFLNLVFHSLILTTICKVLMKRRFTY